VDIRTFEWPDGERWNPLLAELARQQMEMEPGSSLGMATGWSGSKTFLENAKARELERFILSNLPELEDGEQWEVSGWANILGSGDRIGAHDHVRSHLGGVNEWAGCYYVSGCGALLIDGQEIEPKPSLLVVFPSTAIHEVKPVETPEPRISIGFNVRRIERKVTDAA
jgi:hypothetical protein